MIKSILFDLDDTLLDFHKAEKIALAGTLNEMGITPDENILRRYSELNLEQWKLLEKGEITRPELKLRRYRLLFSEFGIDASPEKAAKTYERRLGIGHYFIDGAEEILEALYGKYDLYLVSNGTLTVQKSRIASAGIAKYMKDIFISQEIGADKPSVEFFDRCFEKIPGLKKQETVIIGDSLTSDIKGGENAGIITVWFNPEHKANRSDVIPDHEISRLEEIAELVSGM